MRQQCHIFRYTYLQAVNVQVGAKLVDDDYFCTGIHFHFCLMGQFSAVPEIDCCIGNSGICPGSMPVFTGETLCFR